MCKISALQLKTRELAERLVLLCTKKGLSLGTAESCTGGLIAAAITDVPGASAVFLGGIVSYANEIKEKVLGVSSDTLAAYGAVSEQTAKEMTAGTQHALSCDFSVATTGIAGPGGGTAEKPVGLVYIAVSSARNGLSICSRKLFKGDRTEIRRQTVYTALDLLYQAIESNR